MNREKCI